MTSTEQDAGLASDLDVVDRTLSVSGQFLVDAGCGNMHFAKALAARGASVLAIDPDPVQAALNRKVPTIDNVGFTECGADNIPVENHSVDGVLFPYSLHHVPVDLHGTVFNEVLRILKPTGFLYVLEPVAAGDLNSVMQMFHDERLVRAQAQASLDTLAAPRFQTVEVITYKTPIKYASWDEYANNYARKSYNANYSEDDIRSAAVEARFLELGAPNDFNFESPKRVTLMKQPIIPA